MCHWFLLYCTGASMEIGVREGSQAVAVAVQSSTVTLSLSQCCQGTTRCLSLPVLALGGPGHQLAFWTPASVCARDNLPHIT